MVCKLVVLWSVLAVSQAGFINNGAVPLTLGASRSPIITAGTQDYTPPIHPPIVAPAPVITTRVEPFDPNPQYAYSYDVNDQVTGDSKSQVEHRNGNVVQGRYSLTDPDGSRRTVDYVADPHNGFNAIISRQPPPASESLAAPAPALAQPIIAPHP